MSKDTEQFHDSEVDVYDLYNACNGVVLSNGLPDIKQLDEYTPDEAEELNVPRLREIWEHVAKGCAYCASVIRILDGVRGTLGEGEEEPGDEHIEASDIEASDIKVSDIEAPDIEASDINVNGRIF